MSLHCWNRHSTDFVESTQILHTNYITNGGNWHTFLLLHSLDIGRTMEEIKYKSEAAWKKIATFFKWLVSMILWYFSQRYYDIVIIKIIDYYNLMICTLLSTYQLTWKRSWHDWKVSFKKICYFFSKSFEFISPLYAQPFLNLNHYLFWKLWYCLTWRQQNRGRKRGWIEHYSMWYLCCMVSL